MIKKLFTGLVVTIFILISGLLVGACRVGAWNVIFPSSHHESVAPELPTNLSDPSILVFSKTNEFRHIEGIKAGIAFFDSLATSEKMGIFHTESSAVFNPDDLARFSVVVFNNVTGDVLSDEQQLAFQQWLERGGGWLGLHGAGDGSHSAWPWYVENLIGANFTAHIMGPQFQIATLMVEDTVHVATRGLPPSWEHNEEWYSWDESVRGKGFNILLTVDESTYNPDFDFLFMKKDLRMGDHPMVWNRCIGTGRSLYSALGHSGDAFRTKEYQTLLGDAIKWLMEEDDCTE